MFSQQKGSFFFVPLGESVVKLFLILVNNNYHYHKMEGDTRLRIICKTGVLWEKCAENYFLDVFTFKTFVDTIP